MIPATGPDDQLHQLVAMCRAAADPVHDLLIAGEGNASLTTPEGELFVTASGSRLAALEPGDLTRVDRAVIMAGLETARSDAEWRTVVQSSVPAGAVRPTVEVALHAIHSLAHGPGVVLHTHPTDVLAVMLQGRGAEFAESRVIPDHVVMCGATSWYLDYIDPGLALARAVRDKVAQATARHEDIPNVLLLGHHGIVVTAATAQAALDVTLMVTKAARIFGRAGAGHVQGMRPDDIERIAHREDEHHRRGVLGLVAHTGGSPVPSGAQRLVRDR